MRPPTGRILAILAAAACLFLVFREAVAEEPAPRGGFSFLPLPVLFYTPETKVGGGAALLVIHRPGERPDAFRPSQIGVFTVYTQKNQIQIAVSADLYLPGDGWRLLAETSYEDYPDLYYGIGRDARAEDEESYTKIGPEILLGVQRRIAGGLYAGPRFTFVDKDVRDAEEGSAIATGDLPGSEGATVLSAGFGFSWDRRNHPFLPDGGFLVEGYADFADEGTGSDFATNTFLLDGRAYFHGFGERHSVGAQIYFDARTGSPPFQLLAGLGDGAVLRGYHNRRYTDHLKGAFQAEYRLPLLGRIGAVLFGGLGDVARNIEDFKRSKMKHALGAGLRYAVRPEDRLNIRLDIAFGAGESGFYVNFAEAF